MLYILTFGGDPFTLETLPADEAIRVTTMLNAWWRDNRRAGRILMAARLNAPYTATTIRFVGGQPILCDGAFTTEPEAISGYGIIDVANLDEAVALACSWPGGGYVEIRPLLAPRSPAQVVGYPRRMTLNTEGDEDQ